MIENNEKLNPIFEKVKSQRTNQIDLAPEDYFQSFEGRLMERIALEETKKVQAKKLKISYIQISGIAASALILMLVGSWFLLGNEHKSMSYQKMISMNIEKELDDLEQKDANDFLKLDNQNHLIPSDIVAEKRNDVNQNNELNVFEIPVETEEMDQEFIDEIEMNDLIYSLTEEDIKDLEKNIIENK